MHRYGYTCVDDRELLLLSLLLVRVPNDCLLFFSTSNLHFTRSQKKKLKRQTTNRSFSNRNHGFRFTGIMFSPPPTLLKTIYIYYQNPFYVQINVYLSNSAFEVVQKSHALVSIVKQNCYVSLIRRGINET